MMSSVLRRACLLVSLWAVGATLHAATTPAPRTVEVGFHLLNIAEINEPAETFTAICYLHLAWPDAGVRFEGTEPKIWFDGEAEDKLKEIWRPNVQFANQSTPAETHHTVLTFQPDGTVALDREIEVSLSSELELRGFPFDRQTLRIELESFGYTTKALRFAPQDQRLAMEKKLSLAQWQPGALRWAASAERDALTGEDYHRVTVSLDVRRKPGFYVWQIFVPLFLLIAIAGAVFFLPSGDLADRMNVVVTALLTAVALSYAVHADLPKISYLTVVDRLFVTAYVFLGAKIAVMVTIKRLLESREALALALDRRARWLFPLAYFGLNALLIVPPLLRS